MNVNEMRKYLDDFAKRRGWSEYRTPKNLCMALTVEVGELVEIFQWMNNQQSLLVKNDEKRMQHIQEEMADVLSYLIQLSGVLNVDLEEAFWEKTKKNEEKYPISKKVQTSN